MSSTFQSTPPVKAATVTRTPKQHQTAISIHAAREGGDAAHQSAGRKAPKISIHAAREGGDLGYTDTPVDTPAISIHAAREGGDLRVFQSWKKAQKFQSTPPVKAATHVTCM